MTARYREFDLKLTRHDRKQIRVKREYGEIKSMADKYNLCYDSLCRWCKSNPGVPTETLAKRGPEDPKVSGRRGGLIRQGKEVQDEHS